MTRKRLFAILVIVLVVAAIIGAVAISKFFGEKKELIIIDFDCSAAREHVENLIANGPRMSGSAAEETGVEYIVNQFIEAGLSDCHVEKFSVNMFRINRAEVSLVQYGPFLRVPNPLSTPREFNHITDFVLQGYSGSYDWTSFRDDLMITVIGNGVDPGSYSDASGGACLIEVDENTPGNPEMYTYANDAGVRAIILQNLRSGEEIGYPPMFKSNQAYEDWGGTYPEIPFFMVSKDVGDTLKESLRNSKIRLSFDVDKGPMDLCVAVGEIKGSEKPDEYYIIGGHHDTCYNTLGVVDNTVGPAIICEMATQMAKYEPKYTIRFCTFGGEEEGLYGSIAYFNAHKDEFIGNVKLMSNFDMSHTDITRTSNFIIITSDNSSVDELDDIKKKVVDKTAELEKYDILIIYDDSQWPGSDHWPFVNNGIDVTNAFGGGCYEYHTYLDDISHLNEESLQIGARIMGSYIINEAT